jgi:hypothetical protein
MAKKYTRQIAENSYTAQTADMASTLLWTTDHAGFYRITAMIKLNSVSNVNASVSCNSDAFAPCICSVNGSDNYNQLVVYLANAVNVNIWVKSPSYSYFASWDMQIIVEDFET